LNAPTPQQRVAIQATGHVLVMAGAGAGKTSTLVTRILNRALDSSPPIPIDRMLVVTFNEAAAAEMRHRLGLALDARLQADPDNTWIAEQRALLDSAFVSTLHAFCLRLVREHFHDLDLDPQFAVQDEVQNRVQRNAVLRELLRRYLEGPPPRRPTSARSSSDTPATASTTCTPSSWRSMITHGRCPSPTHGSTPSSPRTKVTSLTSGSLRHVQVSPSGPPVGSTTPATAHRRTRRMSRPGFAPMPWLVSATPSTVPPPTCPTSPRPWPNSPAWSRPGTKHSSKNEKPPAG
jgi:hypothetical protein